jgi:RING-type zinc-finger
MKFDKSLHKQVTGFHNKRYQSFILPYKALKKAIKKKSYSSVLTTICDYCKRTDHVLKCGCDNLFLERSRFWSWLSCSSVDDEVQQEVVEDLLLLCKLNQMALYKICKKGEKRGIKGMWQFYQDMRAHHIYRFLGSIYTARLEYAKTNDVGECPICLEGCEELRPFAIMACGHSMCLDCLYKYANLDKVKATFYNKLHYASSRINCPLCRCKHVFRDLQDYSFIPGQLNMYY